MTSAPRRPSWTGPALGLMIGCTILVELLRPPFVPVNADSDVIAHIAPRIVTEAHLVLNFIIIIPSIWAALSSRTDLRRIYPFLAITMALEVIVLLSLVESGDMLHIAYAIMLLISLVSAMLFVATDCGRGRGFADLMTYAAYSSGLALLIAVALGEYSYGRLASRAGPTFWGMAAILCFCFAPVAPRKIVRAALMLLSVAVLVLASARGAMIAVIVAALAMGAIQIARTPPSRRGWYFIAAAIGIIVLPLVAAIAANGLFDVSDTRRGIGSGATGRAEAWAQAWHLFLSHPILGIGYRRHEQFITVATSAHEAYLAVLAELGLLGFIVYMVLVLGGAIRITGRALRSDDRVTMASSAFLWAYLSIGFTEYLALATGLALPVAMMFVTARAWTTRPARQRETQSKAVVARRRSYIRREEKVGHPW